MLSVGNYIYTMRYACVTYQVIEDISLVEMYCNQSLIFDPFNLSKVFSGHINEGIENIQEVLVCLDHNLSINTSMLEGMSGTCCPYNLQPK